MNITGKNKLPIRKRWLENKSNLTIAFNVLYAKREKKLSCLFSKTTKIVKDKLSF